VTSFHSQESWSQSWEKRVLYQRHFASRFISFFEAKTFTWKKSVRTTTKKKKSLEFLATKETQTQNLAVTPKELLILVPRTVFYL
jgi:hypothetical protein